MKLIRSASVLGLLTLVFALAPMIPNSASPATKAATPAPIDRRIVIKSVNVKDSTVEVEYMQSKKTFTYTIDNVTALTLNGSAGTIDQVKAGMEVEDLIERDGHSLDKLALTGFGTPPATPTEKKPAPKKAAPKKTTTPAPAPAT